MGCHLRRDRRLPRLGQSPVGLTLLRVTSSPRCPGRAHPELGHVPILPCAALFCKNWGLHAAALSLLPPLAWSGKTRRFLQRAAVGGTKRRRIRPLRLKLLRRVGRSSAPWLRF